MTRQKFFEFQYNPYAYCDLTSSPVFAQLTLFEAADYSVSSGRYACKFLSHKRTHKLNVSKQEPGQSRTKDERSFFLFGSVLFSFILINLKFIKLK